MHFGYFCVASCLCWGSYLLFVLVGRKRFGSELATDTLGQTAFNHHHQINTCHAYWKWFLIISDLLQDCAVFESAKPSQTWLNESHTLLSVYVRPKGVRTDMAHASGAFISSISFIIINVSVIHKIRCSFFMFSFFLSLCTQCKLNAHRRITWLCLCVCRMETPSNAYMRHDMPLIVHVQTR